MREAVYLTWLEAESWPCKYSLSYDTNRTCSQKKYLKNANWQKKKKILSDGKRKGVQGVRGGARRREGEGEGARNLTNKGCHLKCAT